jgi:4-amino-4-deoxy-L-arabinose transferase-like glycosyltransferase
VVAEQHTAAEPSATGRLSTPDSAPDGSATRLPQLVLFGVIAVFVALATVISVKTPAWESNDEPGHVQNIETLASGHWYGMHVGHVKLARLGPYVEHVDAMTSAGTEAHQAPLYYLLLAGWQRLAGVSVRRPDPGPADIAYPASGFYVHHSTAGHRFLLWLRLPNVLFGAMTILATFFAARLVTKDPWTPVIAGAVVGFLPRFVFLSAFVTNDNLANTLGALLTLLGLRYLARSTLWRMAAVGAVGGLLVITKESALPLAAVIVVLALGEVTNRQRAQRFAAGVVALVAVCGWWFVQNTVRYGSPLAGGAAEHYLSQIGGIGTSFGVPYTVKDPVTYIFATVPQSFLRVFWYGSGVQEIFHWPWPIGLVFWLALAAALAGLIATRPPPRVLMVLGVLAVTGLASVWIVAFQTGTYDPRLALVGMPALACLASLGLERWRLVVRLVLPLMCLGGTLFAVQMNVLAVHWS